MTYSTQNTKAAHHEHGFFTVGSGSLKILILGSCRVLPYVNYLEYLNGDNRFTIHLIYVVNFNFDAQDKPRDLTQALSELEQKPAFLNMVKSVTLFLHEYTESYGALNTSRKCAKNIYQFGMAPSTDIALPNFNDIHVLAQEQVDYDHEFHDLVKSDMEKAGRIDDQWIGVFRQRGMKRIEHFLNICHLSGVPEFADLFERDWTKRRYFWRGNHVSSIFTMEVFKLINNKCLNLNLTAAFLEYAIQHDPYANPHTPITYIDVMGYGLTWPQVPEQLKL